MLVLVVSLFIDHQNIHFIHKLLPSKFLIQLTFGINHNKSIILGLIITIQQIQPAIKLGRYSLFCLNSHIINDLTQIALIFYLILLIIIQLVYKTATNNLRYYKDIDCLINRLFDNNKFSLKSLTRVIQPAIKTMQVQLSVTCSNFLQNIEEGPPTVKLYKYRHFLSTYTTLAMQIFERMTQYALDKNLLGEYQAIYQIAKKPLQKVGRYKDMRQSMIDFTNPLRGQTEHAQSIYNLQDMVSGYFKLAEYYKNVGMHKQATNYYSKIFRTQSGNKTILQRFHYFSSWAQQLYFDNNWDELNIFIRNDVEDPKKVDCTLALIKDLKFVQLGHTDTKCFENMLTGNYPIDSILTNSLISYTDLGILYSLVVLASKHRQFLKLKTLWSAKLEVLYLQNKFTELLQKIHLTYEKQGKFHPLIDKIYNELFYIIRERVLKKYLSAFTSISIQQITQNTTFSQGQIKMFLKKYNQQPYLIDPITQSVIYYEKSFPLYNQALMYSCLIREKFNEQIKNCLNRRRNDETQLPVFRNREGAVAGKRTMKDRHHEEY